MRCFLKDTGWVVLVTCLVLAFMEIMLCFVPTRYRCKYQYVCTHKQDIDVLMLGNSYFENSCDPHYLSDSAFDLATSARTIYYDAVLTERFVPTMPHLKAVIYPLGYRSQYSTGFPESQDVVFMHAKSMNILLPWNTFPLNLLTWCKTYTRTAISPCKISKIETNKGFDPLIHRHEKGDWKKKQRLQDCELALNETQIQNYCQIEVSYLTRMASVCAQAGVRFIVVTPPCHDSFLEDTTALGMQHLHDIVTSAQQRCPFEYHNYLQDPDFRTDSLHYNSSHLNAIGAKRFALRLRTDFNL